jgi:hypothetical protein
MTKKTTIRQMQLAHRAKTVQRLQVRRGGDALAKKPVYTITRL